ncbi:hypothetical protein [Streptomyces sp. DSM 15324]|uniref:hypothetical protein n=1 Tax=Streptomyces sp. DSM 15324 TaxID=1739111 RepID=UPI001F32C3F9|nr:hypothetical protein [Streptomyces sp. DSM 15324]
MAVALDWALPHDHVMRSPAAFRDQTNWSGGYYELAMEVGSSDDAQLQAVLSALWSAADVHGCFGRRDREPEEQDAVPCTVGSLAEFGHLHGQVRLPTDQLVVCGCVAIRGGDECGDWLDFYVPLGALDHAGLAYWDGQPFFRSNVMDDWLAAIGTETFKSASFSLGVIGFEVSGCTDASTLAGEMPQTRGIGYLLPQGEVLHYGAANT